MPKKTPEPEQAPKADNYAKINMPAAFLTPHDIQTSDGRTFEKCFVSFPKGTKVNGIDVSGFSTDVFLSDYMKKDIRQMVLFLVHRYFLLQLVIPNVIVRLRRVFPTACIRPTVPIGDELLDSISTSAVECFRPLPVIFITPILKYRELGDTVLDDVPSHRPHLLEKLRSGGNHGD